MIKEMKPHVASYVQQLVGGNSNLESKLQALLPGVFADTGAVGKTDRRLNDLAVAIDERQGRCVLLIETLGRDGLRYWSYSGGELKPDDIFSVYTELHSQDECDAWAAFERFLPEISLLSSDELEDHWTGDEQWDLNIFDSRVYGKLEDSIFVCTIGKSSPFEPVTFCVPDWVRDKILGRGSLESGAAD